MKHKLYFSILFLGMITLPAKAWQALQFIDRGTLCDGSARVVGIEIDFTGVQTQGEPAGLNAFVVSLQLSRTDVSLQARAGTSPDLAWSMAQTDTSQILLTGNFTVVGWVADPSAPNTNYHLFDLIITGNSGSLQLTPQISETSFGSHIVNDISETLAFVAGGGVSFEIPGAVSPALGDIVDAWLGNHPTFDVTAPSGVDVADMTQFINCGATF